MFINTLWIPLILWDALTRVRVKTARKPFQLKFMFMDKGRLLCTQNTYLYELCTSSLPTFHHVSIASTLNYPTV